MIAPRQIAALPARIYRFYRDGFRSMTVGRYLWVLILVKLFILFFKNNVGKGIDRRRRSRWAHREEQPEHETGMNGFNGYNTTDYRGMRADIIVNVPSANRTLSG